jgi:hypothetical protein
MNFTPPDGPWTEAPDDLVDSPRAAEFERFFDWLLANKQEELNLPDCAIPYLVLELCVGPTIPKNLGTGVGVSVIQDPRSASRGYHDELRMVVAIGSREDEGAPEDFYSRLTTVAHEMGHLADFWAHIATTPAQAAESGEIHRWPRVAANCHGSIEDLARRLSIEYTLTATPDWPL